jgi:hypothetical protein
MKAKRQYKKKSPNPGWFPKGHKLGLGKKYGIGSKARTGMGPTKGSFKKGHRASPETEFKVGRPKESHWKWKGGISPLNVQIRHCFKYRQWRSDVFTRDDFTCVWCQVRGGVLNADHYPKLFCKVLEGNNIRTLEEALACEELWDINNGRTLCWECHNKTKKYNGR